MMDQAVPGLNYADRKVSNTVFLNNTRIVVLVLSLLCLTLCFSNTIALNFTVICMDDVIHDFHQSNSNSSEIHWLESHDKVNWQFTAIAIGSFLGTIPIAHFLHYFGVRYITTIYGLISALSTLAIPLLVNSYELTFIMRVIQGIPTALSYTIQGMITNSWAGTKESGLYIAVMSTHVQLCSILTMPLSGMLCESMFTWRSVYYIQGIITFLIFAIFFWFYRENPEIHRNVSEKEIRKISIGKQLDTHNNGKKMNLPYREIFTDKCVLSIWLSTIGGTLGFYFFIIYGPIYLNTVIGLDVRATGFATALPYILSAINKFIVGYISDKLTIVSERTRAVIFASFSQGFMGLTYLLLGMHTGPFIHFATAVVSLLGCGVEFLVPIAVWLFVPDNKPEQWHRVFVGIAIIVILASTPFVFFADAKPAHYTLTPAPSQIQKVVPMEIKSFSPNNHKKLHCSELSYEDFANEKSNDLKMQQMQKVLKSSDTRARQIEEFTKQSAMKHNQRVQLLSSSNKVLSPAAVDAAALAGYSPSDFPNPESPENGQKLTEDDKKFIEKMEKQTKLVNNVEAMAQKEMIMQNQLHPVSGASNVQNFRDPLLIPIYAAGLPNYPMPIHPELFYQPIGTSFGNRFSSQHGNIPSSDLGFMGQIPPDQNPNPENTKIWARPGNPEPESEQFQKLPIRNIEIEPPQEPKLAETDLEENIQREKLPSKEN